MKEELQRLADMQADLADKENQLRENDKLQEELDLALEQRQRYCRSRHVSHPSLPKPHHRSIDQEAARLESDKQEFEEKLQTLEKEKQEFEERLWTIERDVQRRQNKEKALNDHIMELLAKNEVLVAEHAQVKATLSKQVQELTVENVRLQNSLALSQARVVSARGTLNSVQPAIENKEVPVAVEPAQEASSGSSVGRLTRSQSQLQRSQEQQNRELLLSKTRSRPSYIPKPASRKIDSTDAGTGNKENSHNNADTAEEPPKEARKQRASMIPIRKGSSLVAPQVKALRS